MGFLRIGWQNYFNIMIFLLKYTYILICMWRNVRYNFFDFCLGSTAMCQINIHCKDIGWVISNSAQCVFHSHGGTVGNWKKNSFDYKTTYQFSRKNDISLYDFFSIFFWNICITTILKLASQLLNFTYLQLWKNSPILSFSSDQSITISTST